MLKRILTAAVLIAVLAAVLFIGGWAPSIALIVITAAAMFEIYRAFAARNIKCITYTGYAFAALMAPAYRFAGAEGIIILLGLCAFCAAAHVMFSQKHEFSDAVYSVFALIYPGMFLSFLYMLSRIEPYSAALPALLAAVIFAVMTDTGAYFTGVLIGRHPLIPRLSPKKTVEGAIGGYVFCVLSGVAMWALAPTLMPETDGMLFIWISLGAGILSQLGDLMASAIKRFCGIKDYGKIFPGHGGILDRMDSIMAVGAIVYAVYVFSGVI